MKAIRSIGLFLAGLALGAALTLGMQVCDVFRVESDFAQAERETALVLALAAAHEEGYAKGWEDARARPRRGKSQP